MAKMELIAKIGKAMKRLGDNGDDVLRKTMGRISEGTSVFQPIQDFFRLFSMKVA